MQNALLIEIVNESINFVNIKYENVLFYNVRAHKRPTMQTVINNIVLLHFCFIYYFSHS